jgi:hypothetical protein
MTYNPPLNTVDYAKFVSRLNPAIRKFKGTRGDVLIEFPEFEPELLKKFVAKYKKHKSGFYSDFRMKVIGNTLKHT